MIELKYLSKEEAKNNKKQKIEQKVKEAKEQLAKYDKGDRYIKVVIVFVGYEMEVIFECLMF